MIKEVWFTNCRWSIKRCV